MTLYKQLVAGMIAVILMLFDFGVYHRIQHHEK